MSAFAHYVSSDSEEDEEYEKRCAESNRKAKLNMERMKAKQSLEKKRAELKKARLEREDKAKNHKEHMRYQEEEALRVALASLSEEERLQEQEKMQIQHDQQQEMSNIEENDIIQELVNAYIDDENNNDDKMKEIEEENEKGDKETVTNNEELVDVDVTVDVDVDANGGNDDDSNVEQDHHIADSTGGGSLYVSDIDIDMFDMTSKQDHNDEGLHDMSKSLPS